LFDDFKKDYYGIDSLVGGTQVNVATFKRLFPIVVFDVRIQNETLKTAVMAIQVKFEFSAAVPANTIAYSVMISDRFYKLSSDGKNTNILSMLFNCIFYFLLQYIMSYCVKCKKMLISYRV